MRYFIILFYFRPGATQGTGPGQPSLGSPLDLGACSGLLGGWCHLLAPQGFSHPAVTPHPPRTKDVFPCEGPEPSSFDTGRETEARSGATAGPRAPAARELQRVPLLSPGDPPATEPNQTTHPLHPTSPLSTCPWGSRTPAPGVLPLGSFWGRWRSEQQHGTNCRVSFCLSLKSRNKLSFLLDL